MPSFTDRLDSGDDAALDDTAVILAKYQEAMQRFRDEELRNVAEYLSQPTALGSLRQQAAAVSGQTDTEAIVGTLVTASASRVRQRAEQELRNPRLTPRAP